MNILIVGSSGFIGSAFKRFFLAHSPLNIVYGLDRIPDSFVHPRFASTCFDLLYDYGSTISYFLSHKFDVIVNCAARTDLDGRTISEYKDNYLIPSLFCEILNSSSFSGRLIHFSSMLRDAPPHSISYCYGASKKVGDNILMTSAEFSYFIIELPSVWGPYMKAPYLGFFKSVLAGRFFYSPLFSGQKSFLYVGNLFSLVNHVSLSSFNDSYIVASDFTLNTNEFARRIAEIADVRLRSFPSFVVYLFALSGSFLRIIRIPFPLNLFRLANMKNGRIVLQNRPAHSNLYSHSLDDAIRETLCYIEGSKGFSPRS